MSNSVVGAPNLEVNFTQGSTVVGNNVNGGDAPVRPGQSATDAVGAVGNSGQLLKFTGCQMISYELVTATGGGQTGTFTP